jgi:cytidine deaminase
MKNDALITQARSTRDFSYSPYSKFPVGAAVEMDSGKVFTGTNIENASYGLTICAERVAIFNAISQGETKIKRIAISCPSTEGSANSLMPCGACRQVISEFSTPSTIIIVDGVGEFKINDLLPQAFEICYK